MSDNGILGDFVWKYLKIFLAFGGIFNAYISGYFLCESLLIYSKKVSQTFLPLWLKAIFRRYKKIAKERGQISKNYSTP